MVCKASKSEPESRRMRPAINELPEQSLPCWLSHWNAFFLTIPDLFLFCVVGVMIRCPKIFNHIVYIHIHLRSGLYQIWNMRSGLCFGQSYSLLVIRVYLCWCAIIESLSCCTTHFWPSFHCWTDGLSFASRMLRHNKKCVRSSMTMYHNDQFSLIWICHLSQRWPWQGKTLYEEEPLKGNALKREPILICGTPDQMQSKVCCMVSVCGTVHNNPMYPNAVHEGPVSPSVSGFQMMRIPTRTWALGWIMKCLSWYPVCGCAKHCAGHSSWNCVVWLSKSKSVLPSVTWLFPSFFWVMNFKF